MKILSHSPKLAEWPNEGHVVEKVRVDPPMVNEVLELFLENKGKCATIVVILFSPVARHGESIARACHSATWAGACALPFWSPAPNFGAKHQDTTRPKKGKARNIPSGIASSRIPRRIYPAVQKLFRHNDIPRRTGSMRQSRVNCFNRRKIIAYRVPEIRINANSIN